MSVANTFVGRPIERLEDLRLLRGRGIYVDDVVQPGVLHLAVLRSSVAHGRLTNVEFAEAASLPGVVAVVTGAMMGEVPRIPLRLSPLPELEPYWQPVIADGKVRYVGEPVAIVVAESGAIAEDALDLITVEIESLPPAVDTATALSDRSLLFEAMGSNRALIYVAQKGDALAEFPGSYVRRERFDTQRHTALTMELRGVMASWDVATERMTVYGAAKVPFANRGILARQLKLPESAIDMIENDVGGGFGMRGEFYPEDFLVPYAARLLGRPVKWIEDRREHLQSANHAREFDCELEIVCTREGDIQALRGTANCNIGAYLRANVAVAPRNVGQFLSGPYRVPNIHIETAAVMTNKTPSGTYRGPGRFEADFFRERLLDLAAKDLGIDPVAFRRRNLVTSAEMPYQLATVSPPTKEEELDSGDYAMTLDGVLEEIGWEAKQVLQGTLVNGRYHGLAVGCFIEGGAAGPREGARMVLKADGAIEVFVGSTIVGQGLETVLTQIAADALGVEMEQIRLFHGSTTYVREGFGSYHSRSTVMGGSAILLAADALHEAMRKAAGLRLNCGAAEVRLEDGFARAPHGAKLSFAELGAEEIAAEGVFSNHTHTYSYGAAAAHVAVDVRTAQVDVLDFVVVEDVGCVINPLSMQGQVIGAVVQGLGGVFLEHLVYDADGQLLTGSLADYLVPVATDYPSIRAVVMGKHRATISPLGAKGAGEGGVIPVGGVIANAIANALTHLGVEPRSLPLSESRLWRLINAPGGPSAQA